ncbi:MAG: extracellular solute-binding protein [Chthoniobacterales bacterium]|nr:extracellular solute-binding protein [Chthoniobacterales bacterium]
MRFPLIPMLRLCAVALLLGACTPPREAPNRLVIWHQKTGAERSFFEGVIRDYNRLHPGDKVTALYREGEELRNSFIIAAVAGQGPDMVFGPSDNVALFAETRVIRPWDDVLDGGFLGRFTKEGVVLWNDKTWLVADQIGNQLMLVYDRQMVERPPETLGDLVRLGRDLTLRSDGRTDRYALTWNYAEPYFFIPFLTGFGGWIMDEEGNPTLDTPEMRAALQFVLDLRDKHQLIPRYEDYNTANLMFLRRRAAMIINGPWSWAEYDVPKRSMLALLPVNESTGLRCRPIIAAKGYSLCVNTPEAKFPMVRRLLAYLTGEEMQLAMAERLFTIPTLHTALAAPAFTDNPVLQLAREQAKHSVPMPIIPQLRYIWDGIRGPYRRVMTGSLTAAEGARLMQKEAEDRIAEGMP